MQLMLMGRVVGTEQVRQMLGRAPAYFQRTILGWLLKEVELFIGSKKADGIIRGNINKKRRWVDGRSWRTNVVNLFRGQVVDVLTGQAVNFKSMQAGAGTGATGRGFSMVCRMGVLYRTQKDIHRALEFLESGGRISSDKYMPVPLKGSDIDKSYVKFKHWLRTGEIHTVYRNGLVLYFLKDKLVFVGRKAVNVLFSHRLTAVFDMRRPEVEARGNLAVERAAVAVSHSR